MYGGTFINPKKSMCKKCHTYEQKNVNIWGLPAQNYFPYIFTKN